MTITIGTLSFDNVEYDADADVLYLSVGEPRMPAESFGTPEGHNIRYDEIGAVIAIQPGSLGFEGGEGRHPAASSTAAVSVS